MKVKNEREGDGKSMKIVFRQKTEEKFIRQSNFYSGHVLARIYYGPNTKRVKRKKVTVSAGFSCMLRM